MPEEEKFKAPRDYETFLGLIDKNLLKQHSDRDHVAPINRHEVEKAFGEVLDDYTIRQIRELRGRLVAEKARLLREALAIDALLATTSRRIR